MAGASLDIQLTIANATLYLGDNAKNSTKIPNNASRYSHHFLLREPT